ncbi:MAG: hypothetical protein LBE70_02850 [Nitrososphaerota archaeon]|nr:hypothetical protein [Nitrososphaerota archaeon]
MIYRVQWVVSHSVTWYEGNYDNIIRAQLYVDDTILGYFSKYVDFNGPDYYVTSVCIGSTVATSGAVGEFFLDDFTADTTYTLLPAMYNVVYDANFHHQTVVKVNYLAAARLRLEHLCQLLQTLEVYHIVIMFCLVGLILHLLQHLIS